MWESHIPLLTVMTVCHAGNVTGARSFFTLQKIYKCVSGIKIQTKLTGFAYEVTSSGSESPVSNTTF